MAFFKRGSKRSARRKNKTRARWRWYANQHLKRKYRRTWR